MSIFRCGSWTLSIWWTLFVLYCFHIVVFLYFCRLEREEMLVWIKLPYLKAKWLVAMENKFWAGMCTGWDSFSIFSGCCHSITPLLVIMCALWYNECSTCNLYCLYCVISVYSLETSSQIFIQLQMTVLTVYIFLYGRAYLVIQFATYFIWFFYW